MTYKLQNICKSKACLTAPKNQGQSPDAHPWPHSTPAKGWVQVLREKVHEGHRVVEVGRDLWMPVGPTPCPSRTTKSQATIGLLCWLEVNLVPTSNPKPFPAKLLSSWAASREG